MRIRRDGAATALLMLLTLGLGEPLLCIFHCQVWLPAVFHGHFAARHHHHHAHVAAAHAAESTPLPAGVGGIYLSGEPAAGLCFIHQGRGNGSDLPFHLPPSPVHEMTPVLVPVLVVLLAVSFMPEAPPGAPPDVFIPPPLRPPILIAG